MGAVSLPGQVSFVTSIAPICLAMGVPIEPLALLIAVEILPDIVRTLGNVSMDVAATATVARRTGFDEAEMGEEDVLLQEDERQASLATDARRELSARGRSDRPMPRPEA